ncbi:MAG: hypothetical protein NXI31_10025 [bacterium]|nr:hypothetical protein [bacterium]
MIGDELYRRCVTALWALIGSLRPPRRADAEEILEEALRALHAARGSESFILLHEIGSALHVNGRMLPMSVDVFAAAKGIATLLREQRVGEVMFDATVDGPALAAWAEAMASSAPESGSKPAGSAAAVSVNSGFGELSDSSAGITVSLRDDVTVGLSLAAGERADDAPDSRLRSMFLQHHLIVAFGTSSWVPPHQAKVAIAAVVDRMLGLPGGMEPLMVLQREPELLYRSLHVAVLVVVMGRVVGFPEERLADLGAAALLHDIGQALDAEDPVRAGLVWLIERGGDDFWLNSAIVAGSWRREHGCSLAELGPGDSLQAALVRLAAAIERLTGSSPELDRVETGLRRAAEQGVLPRELVDLAVATLDQWAGAA